MSRSANTHTARRVLQSLDRDPSRGQPVTTSFAAELFSFLGRLKARGALGLGLFVAGTSACSGPQLLGSTDSGVPEGPFQSPTLIAELSDPQAEDEGPTLTADELEIFFESDREGSRDIWTAHRPTIEAEWSPPERVDAVSTDLAEQDPAVAWDGSSLWFIREQVGGPSRLWVSARGSSSNTWGEPVPVAELDAASNLRAPAVSGDGLSIVYCLFEGPVGGADMMLSERDSLGAPWTAPRTISELDTSYDDWDPFLSFDARQLFWVSTQRHIVWARSGNDGVFRDAQPVDGTGQPAFDPSLSRDLHRLYFASDRGGTADIYVAER